MMETGSMAMDAVTTAKMKESVAMGRLNQDKFATMAILMTMMVVTLHAIPSDPNGVETELSMMEKNATMAILKAVTAAAQNVRAKVYQLLLSLQLSWALLL